MVTYNKLVCSALLLACTTTISEATSSKRSKLVRGASKTGRLLGPKSSKKSKTEAFANPKGEDVCLSPAVLYEIEGPTTPISGATDFLFPECNAFLAIPPDTDGYVACLVDNDVIIGPWFFNRDTPGSQFVFTDAQGGTNGSDGSACTKITKTKTEQPGSKAEIELWSEEFFGTKLADLTSFSVDYKVVSQRLATEGAATDQYFITLYTRTEASRSTFYDCNFAFIPDAGAPLTAVPTDWKSFTFDLDTPLDFQRTCPSTSSFCLPVPTAPALDCTAFTTLRDMLTAFPNTVIGVGNGQLETIDLVTGETGSTYKGLEVCWDNVQIAVQGEETIVYDFEAAN